MTRSTARKLAPFDRLAVLGLGLLGGSVALAARQRGVAKSVVGAGRGDAGLDAVGCHAWGDEVAKPKEAVRGADLVVLATPVNAMPSVIEEVASQLENGALVTDVGSVKGALADLLPGLLPPGVHYVGSHPMAGSHLRGREHARADLFEGAGCAVTPLPDTEPAALARIVAFWEALGARVVLREPSLHDAHVAWISHLPHALASAFAWALAKAPGGAGELAGAGFRDFTRIAQGDPKLWADILAANRKALAGPLQACGDALAALSEAIEAGDAGAIENFLCAARASLSALAEARSESEGAAPVARDARSGGASPEIWVEAKKRDSARLGRNNNNS